MCRMWSVKGVVHFRYRMDGLRLLARTCAVSALRTTWYERYPRVVRLSSCGCAYSLMDRKFICSHNFIKITSAVSSTIYTCTKCFVLFFLLVKALLTPTSARETGNVLIHDHLVSIFATRCVRVLGVQIAVRASGA